MEELGVAYRNIQRADAAVGAKIAADVAAVTSDCTDAYFGDLLATDTYELREPLRKAGLRYTD